MRICVHLFPIVETFLNPQAAPAKKPSVPLPDWLANTLYTLESEHPLRGLLSPSRNIVESVSGLLPAEPPSLSHEEQVFAFSPFNQPEEVCDPPAAYPTDHYLNIQEVDLPVISGVLTLCDLEPQAPGVIGMVLDPLPFSTPGYFAPKCQSLENLPVDVIAPIPQFQHQWSPKAQRDTSSLVTLAPLLSAPYNKIKQPRFTREFMTFAPDTLAPARRQRAVSDVFSREFQIPEENIKVYATPGPTFTCSRPVYFNSPTEDTSFSDSLEPEAYELDLSAIDFRWRPFMGSNMREGQANRQAHCASRPQSLGSAASKKTGDQTGWKTQIAVGHVNFDASNKRGLSDSLQGEVYLEFSPNAIQQAELATGIGAANETIGLSSHLSPVNEGKEAEVVFAPAPGIFISPLSNRLGSPDTAVGIQPCADEENVTMSTNKELPLLSHEEARLDQPYEMRPSTPMRQIRMSQPATPRKDKSSQPRCEHGPLLRKASSALSWMISSRTPKREVILWDDVESKVSQASGKSYDTIESWSGFGRCDDVGIF
ncbi:hypothetical protein BS17DRAFT_782950 [Gyrodon lividus]|nr:hypothetical protein BS17DRAFT_782950 [Gyrodon lividus]